MIGSFSLFCLRVCCVCCVGPVANPDVHGWVEFEMFSFGSTCSCYSSCHQIDQVVGTHSLLSRKVEFPNLGLLVIDEEQKFGVNQKEKLKVMGDG